MFNESIPVGHYEFTNRGFNADTIVIPMYSRPNKFKQWVAWYILGILWVEYIQYD